MAIYTLHSESTKSNICLQTDHDVPEDAAYIEYKDQLFRRSDVKRADGNPDPYLWEELSAKETPDEDAVIVRGKDLIAQTSHTTTSAQRRGLNVERLDGAAATALALEEANSAKNVAINAQIEAETRAAAAEKELEELRATLAQMQEQEPAAEVEQEDEEPAAE